MVILQKNKTKKCRHYHFRERPFTYVYDYRKQVLLMNPLNSIALIICVKVLMKMENQMHYPWWKGSTLMIHQQLGKS